MKQMLSILTLICIAVFANAQSSMHIKLSAPDFSRSATVMTALSQRSSASAYDTTEMNIKTISDLCWAANGINRQESGKRTAASSYNAQDIDVYLFLTTGAYIYNPKDHQLELVVAGDHRYLLAATQDFVRDSKQIFLLVSDISRFKKGEQSEKLRWAAIDAGLVAQNIMIFCASEGFLARPRVFMENEKLSGILKLNENQHLILNIPVSYKK